MANKKCICLSFATVLGAIGIALLVLASLVVNFVNDRIDTGVSKALKIEKNYGSWDSDRIDDYINTSTNYSYYAWNLTNMAAVLAGTQKPLLQQVGPYNVTQYETKYNISWSDDGTTVLFNDWWVKKWNTAQDEKATTDLIYSVNPAYIGAVGLLNNVTYGATTKDSVLFSQFAPIVMAGFKDTYLNASGSIISAFRILSIPAYLNTIMAVASPALGSQSAVIQQWGNATALLAATLSNENLKCFEVNSPPTDSNIPVPQFALTPSEASLLWSPSNPLAINGSGIAIWLQALTGSSTAASQLVATYGSTVYGKVATWIGATTSLLTYCNYTSTAATPYFSMTKLGFYSTVCPAANSWSDIGACQFGSSNVTTALGLGSTAFALSPSMNTYCNGLNTLGMTYQCKGPEIAAFSSVSSNCAAGQVSLSISESRAFLESFSRSGAYALNTTCGVTPSGTGGLFSLLSQLSVNPSLVTTLNALFGNAGFTTTRAANGQATCMGNYMTAYAANYFGIIANVINMNGGIFTFRSVSEIMFGYPLNNNDPLLGGLGRTYDGLISNYSSLEQHYQKTGQKRYEYYTGTADINYVRQYKAYRGYSQFKNLAQTYRESECLCSSWNPCSPSVCTARTCYDVYRSEEDLDKTSDASNFAPFQEDIPATRLKVFNSDAMRTLYFIYLKDVEVKGIKMRRFVLDPNQLKNSSEYAPNEKYNQTGPTGVVDIKAWANQAPVFLSRPQFAYEGDPSLFTPFNSSSFASYTDESLQTYIDVEPLSGATMQGHKRLQYTLKLSTSMFDNQYYTRMFNMMPTDWVDSTKKSVYWPAFWADENGLIEDGDASDFRKLVYSNRDMADNLEIAGYCVGAFFVFTAVAIAFFFVRKPAFPSSNSNTLDSTRRLESRNDL